MVLRGSRSRAYQSRSAAWIQTGCEKQYMGHCISCRARSWSLREEHCRQAGQSLNAEEVMAVIQPLQLLNNLFQFKLWSLNACKPTRTVYENIWKRGGIHTLTTCTIVVESWEIKCGVVAFLCIHNMATAVGCYARFLPDVR